MLRKVQKFSSVQKDSSIDEIPIKVKSRVGGVGGGGGAWILGSKIVKNDLTYVYIYNICEIYCKHMKRSSGHSLWIKIISCIIIKKLNVEIL